MPGMQLSDEVVIVDIQDLLDIGGTDIHNGVAAANWVDMALCDRILFVVEVGPTWNAADQLDTLHIMQANTAAGGATKALLPAVNLNQTAANTTGERFGLEVTAAHCDTENGFHWVRLECGEVGDTGVDEVRATAICYGRRYQGDNLSNFTQLA